MSKDMSSNTEAGQDKKIVSPGRVWLLGAGPGARDLLTLKGARVLSEAQVVVYDALVGPEVLSMVPEDAELIDVGKRSGNHTMPQEEINQVLAAKAKEGRRVVRLKGGDPFLFGRGGEELKLLAEEGVPFEVIPGVTSALAVPAYNGIPVTYRDFCSSVHVITGHRRANFEYDIDFKALVETRGTLIFLMGIASLPMICSGLIEGGMDPDMPAAVLSRGTTARQARVVATVGTLPQEIDAHPLATPAIIVVGRVCELADDFDWFTRQPLFGMHVLVTRPKELISGMADRLRRKGAQVLELPAIRTIPEPDLAERLRICFSEQAADETAHEQNEGALAGSTAPVTHTAPATSTARTDPAASAAPVVRTASALSAPYAGGAAWDWAVFTSPTGVRVFMEGLKEADLDIRVLAGTKIAAIGSGTAKMLREYGIRTDLIPEVYDGRSLGAALSKVLEPGMRVLIPRAKIGTQELIEEMNRVPDLTIADVATYDTQYATGGAVNEKEMIESGEIDYAVFTSASTVRGFAHAIGDMDYTKVRAVCIGKQTKAAADELGMQTWMAEKATMDAVVSKLEQLAGGA